MMLLRMFVLLSALWCTLVIVVEAQEKLHRRTVHSSNDKDDTTRPRELMGKGGGKKAKNSKGGKGDGKGGGKGDGKGDGKGGGKKGKGAGKGKGKGKGGGSGGDAQTKLATSFLVSLKTTRTTTTSNQLASQRDLHTLEQLFADAYNGLTLARSIVAVNIELNGAASLANSVAVRSRKTSTTTNTYLYNVEADCLVDCNPPITLTQTGNFSDLNADDIFYDDDANHGIDDDGVSNEKGAGRRRKVQSLESLLLPTDEELQIAYNDNIQQSSALGAIDEVTNVAEMRNVNCRGAVDTEVTAVDITFEGDLTSLPNKNQLELLGLVFQDTYRETSLLNAELCDLYFRTVTRDVAVLEPTSRLRRDLQKSRTFKVRFFVEFLCVSCPSATPLFDDGSTSSQRQLQQQQVHSDDYGTQRRVQTSTNDVNCICPINAQYFRAPTTDEFATALDSNINDLANVGIIDYITGVVNVVEVGSARPPSPPTKSPSPKQTPRPSRPETAYPTPAGTSYPTEADRPSRAPERTDNPTSSPSKPGKTSKPTKEPSTAPGGTDSPVAPSETGSPVAPNETGSPVSPSETGSPVSPSETGSPVAPSETGSPVAPSETGSPVPPSGTGSPVAPSETGSPSPAVGTGSPVAPSETGSPSPAVGTGSPVASGGSDSPSPAVGTGSPVAPSETGSPVAPSGTGSPAASGGSDSPVAPSNTVGPSVTGTSPNSSPSMAPVVGGITAAPTATPVFGGTTTAPTATPVFGGTTTAPTATPVFGGTTTAPTATPVFEGTTTAPTATPVFGGTTAAPTATPVFGGTTTAPTAAPVAGGTPTFPTTAPVGAPTTGTTTVPPVVAGAPSIAPTATPVVGGTTVVPTSSPVIGGIPTLGTLTIPPVIGGIPTLGTLTIPPVIGGIPTLGTLTIPPVVGGIPTLATATTPPVVGGIPTIGTTTTPPVAGGTPSVSRSSNVSQNGSTTSRSGVGGVQFDALEEEARSFQFQYTSRAPSVSPSSLASESVTASDALPEGLSEEDRDVVNSIVTEATLTRSSSGGQLQFASVELDQLEAAAMSFRTRRHSDEGGRQLKESI